MSLSIVRKMESATEVQGRDGLQLDGMAGRPQREEVLEDRLVLEKGWRSTDGDN